MVPVVGLWQRVEDIVPRVVVVAHVIKDARLIVYILIVILVVEEIILSRTFVIVMDFAHLLLVRPQSHRPRIKN